jgi:hypothetical protein
MLESPSKSIWLELQIDPQNPQLLANLDRLLQSGMLTPEQIIQIAQACLSERLPLISALAASPVAVELIAQTLAPAETLELPAAPTLWQTLRDELSVRWLLFLGVFLVVLSSGVLAATQWSRFPGWGQYGLLWLYTIGFWVSGRWSKQQSGLKLTANTLQMAALLLVPVNFWAIDSFGLWHQVWEVATAIVAIVSLAGIVYFSNQRRASNNSRWLTVTYFALSCLHLGWQIPNWATITIYVGAIGLAIVLQKTRQIGRGNIAIYGLGVLLLRGIFVAHLPFTSFALAVGILGWLFAQWSMEQEQQLIRVKSIIQKNPSLRLVKYQKNLARVVTLYSRVGAGLLGIGWLLGLGDWEVSSWQPMAVNILALTWTWQRIRRPGNERDVAILFLIGLQAYWLNNFLWRFLSTGALLAKVLPTIKLLFGENYLYAGSLLIFPYLLFWIWLTAKFWRRQQESLCRIGEKLMLATGILATAFSAASPLGLLVSLLFSTVFLKHVAQRHLPVRSSYVYLTHFCGILTIFAAINYRWEWCKSIGSSWISPVNNSFGNEDILLLLVVGTVAMTVLAVIELCFSARTAQPDQDNWQRSAWDFGRILTVLASVGFGLIQWALPTIQGFWPILWISIPAAFTYLSKRRLAMASWQFMAQLQSGWWAIAGLLSAVLLSISSHNWLSVMLAAAVGMTDQVVRSMVRQHSQPARSIDLASDAPSALADEPASANSSIFTSPTIAAMSQIGFFLALGINLLRHSITNSQWLIVGAVVCSGLWLISKKIVIGSNSLHQTYGVASDLWAIGLATVGLSIGSRQYLDLHGPGLIQQVKGFINPPQANDLLPSLITTSQWFNSISFNTLIATTILGWAMFDRQRWRETSITIPRWLWYGISLITTQIGLSAGVNLWGGNTLTLAVVNIFLALLLWTAQTYQQSVVRNGFLSSRFLPGWLALMGLCLRLPFFNSYTGALTIGVGLVGILISRSYRLKWSAYIGLLLMTWGGYELVSYQISQAPAGGNIADALTIYGAVTATLALIYRLGVWFKVRQNQEYWWDLPLTNILSIAHIHWVIASVWQVSAALLPVTPLPRFTLIYLLVSGLLGIYAVIQARNNERRNLWVYLGWAELVGTAIYARSIFSNLGVIDNTLIILSCLVGLLLLLAPWRKWGWDHRPWGQVAIILPLTRVPFEWDYISLLNLVVLGIFYGGVSRRQQQFGYAYLSLIFANWAGIRLLLDRNLTGPIWYALLIGLSVLAAVQWDPIWRRSRHYRHYGRIGGAGVIAVTALIAHQPWLPIVLSLVIGAIGLAWRVRAWLYVGTITFLLTNFYQLVVLITEQPITKWAIGLLAGILIIFLAANFERRREQITQALQHWFDRLEEWQ